MSQDSIPNGSIDSGSRAASPVDVGTLGEILGAGSYDELSDWMTSRHRGGADGHTGTFPVPPGIREALVTADLEIVAERWGATDELANWPAPGVRERVSDLRELAAQATAEGRDLWVWWST